jgi:hypothetical protein
MVDRRARQFDQATDCAQIAFSSSCCAWGGIGVAFSFLIDS